LDQQGVWCTRSSLEIFSGSTDGVGRYHDTSDLKDAIVEDPQAKKG
jgi:hypothetical protein